MIIAHFPYFDKMNPEFLSEDGGRHRFEISGKAEIQTADRPTVAAFHCSANVLQ
jgi:hypothetical protein